MVMSWLESIGFYESLVIIAIFSAFVIITDEIMHARMRKRRTAQGAKLPSAH